MAFRPSFFNTRLDFISDTHYLNEGARTPSFTYFTGELLMGIQSSSLIKSKISPYNFISIPEYLKEVNQRRQQSVHLSRMQGTPGITIADLKGVLAKMKH